MRSEMLLYGYGLICICIFLFDVVYSFVLKEKDRALAKREIQYAQRLEEQSARLKEGMEVAGKHKDDFKRKLSYVERLTAYEHALCAAQAAADEGKRDILDEYCRQMQPVWYELALLYQRRDNMQAAYYAYFLSAHERKAYLADGSLQRVMLEYIKKESLYCRVNALQALYRFGTEENILEALAFLDGIEGCPQEKILTDGLLSFEGDHARLISLFWERLADFSDRMQLAILNYIRFRTGEYRENMFAIMTDQEKNKELRLSAIRYFGRYEYAPARDVLLAFARDTDPMNWEYSAISISSLARYRGTEVAETLMAAMHRGNWYVRYNAAASLDAWDLAYSDLLEVVGGHDRYAREMMMYRMDLRRMQGRG